MDSITALAIVAIVIASGLFFTQVDLHIKLYQIEMKLKANRGEAPKKKEEPDLSPSDSSQD